MPAIPAGNLDGRILRTIGISTITMTIISITITTSAVVIIISANIIVGIMIGIGIGSMTRREASELISSHTGEGAE